MHACAGLAVLAAILGGCVATSGAGARVERERIDLSYKLSSAAWTGGGHLLFITRMNESAGKLRLCGAYGPANADPRAAALSRDVADSTTIYLGQTRVANGVGFLARHDGSRNPVGQPANCVITALDWRPEFAIEETHIRLGRNSF